MPDHSTIAALISQLESLRSGVNPLVSQLNSQSRIISVLTEENSPSSRAAFKLLIGTEGMEMELANELSRLLVETTRMAETIQLIGARIENDLGTLSAAITLLHPEIPEEEIEANDGNEEGSGESEGHETGNEEESNLHSGFFISAGSESVGEEDSETPASP